VIRRVRAVIQVPIKEEERGECLELDVGQPPDPAVLRPPSTPTGTSGDTTRRKSSVGSHHRSEVAPSDYNVDGGEEALSDDDQSYCDEYVNQDEEREEEREEVAMYAHAARRKTVPWGQKHICHEPDEEDDELMMYANFKVLYNPSSLSNILNPFVDTCSGESS
jgi:hypothetical protein